MTATKGFHRDDIGVVQFHRWRPEPGATGLNENVSGGAASPART